MKYLSQKVYIIIVLLCSLILLSIPASAVQSTAFQKTQAYSAFSDVPQSAWYSANVKSVCEYGLMNGKGNNLFDPNGYVTYHEGIALACRLHKLYHEGTADFKPSSPWYKTYMDYAAEHGMSLYYDVVPSLYWLYSSTPYEENNLPRNVFAKMISLALPDDMLDPINSVEEGAIPDISLYQWDDWCRDDVYRLYRAGIITGKNERGTLDPYSYLTRAEAAAILSRVIDKNMRKNVELKALTGGEVTEATARSMAESLDIGEIKRIVCTDFDFDGQSEAFIITEGERRWSKQDYFGDKESCIWFVSDGRVDCLCSCPGGIGFDEDVSYDDFENLKIFRAWGNAALRYQAEGQGIAMYTVKDGKAERIDLPNYRIEEDELFSGVDAYEMFPEGTMYTHSLAYLPEKNAYLVTTTQVIYSKDGWDRGVSPFINTECLIEYNKDTNQFEWTMRHPEINEGGCYDYEKVKAVLDESGGWVPSPAKKSLDGKVSW